jgi:hypothetical protein
MVEEEMSPEADQRTAVEMLDDLLQDLGTAAGSPDLRARVVENREQAQAGVELKR